MVASQVIIQNITVNELSQLEQFVNNTDNNFETFRYYDKRPLHVIKDHIVTVIMLLNDRAIGYGHLDRDEEIVWLGIAINKKFQGMGLGKKMMKYLINTAINHKLSKISLTVDQSNTPAIKLYELFGFVRQRKVNEQSVLMEYLIS